MAQSFSPRQLQRSILPSRLTGQVLPENRTMLQLSRAFGLRIAVDPRDRKLERVSKMLRDVKADAKVIGQ
jgi:hypothetical protein